MAGSLSHLQYMFFVESTETVLFGFSIFAEVRNVALPNKKSAKNFHDLTMLQGGPQLLSSYKWSYNPCKWLYERVTRVLTFKPICRGPITPFVTGYGPPWV